MGELGGEPDFAEKPIGADRLRDIGPQNLEGDIAIVAKVVGEVDRGHPAAAELTFYRIGLCERRLELGAEVGRHAPICRANTDAERPHPNRNERSRSGTFSPAAIR